MKKIVIIGGLSLMTAGTPNKFAIATGSFFVAVGITYKF